MAKYGFDTVRGGAYVEVELPEEQEDSLRHELHAATDSCLKCGKSGHFANQYKKEHHLRVNVGVDERLWHMKSLCHINECVSREIRQIDMKKHPIVKTRRTNGNAKPATWTLFTGLLCVATR